MGHGADNTFEIKSKKITWAGLRNAFKLYKYIKPFRLQFGIGIFFLLGTSLATLAFPKLFGNLVNAGSSGQISDNINRAGLILVAVIIFQSVFSYFRTITFVNVTEKSLAYLRQSTYNHLIKLPIKFFEQKRVGELNSRISSDVTLLQETLTTTLAEFIREVIIIFGGITVLAFTSFRLTLFTMAILPPMVIIVYIFGGYIRKFSKKIQKEVANSNTIVEETLQGIQSVKTYTNEFLEIARYKKKTSEIAKIGMKAGKYRGAFSALIITGIFGTIVAVLWKGSVYLSEGIINAGDLFSFLLYSVFIGGNIGGMADDFARIQKFIGATEDLFEIFETKEETITNSEDLMVREPLSGNIEFKNLSFPSPARTNQGDHLIF